MLINDKFYKSHNNDNNEMTMNPRVERVLVYLNDPFLVNTKGMLFSICIMKSSREVISRITRLLVPIGLFLRIGEQRSISLWDVSMQKQNRWTWDCEFQDYFFRLSRFSNSKSSWELYMGPLSLCSRNNKELTVIKKGHKRRP